LSLLGILRFNISDSITSLYTPSKKLQKTEILYNKISNENFENTQIITVKGRNHIEAEEKITNILKKNNINYISISKFIPSAKIQKENFELVQNLYKNNLDNYSNILSSKQINSLKNSTFKPVEFNLDNYSFLNNFILDENTSLVFAFTKDKINIKNSNYRIINIKSDIENYMKKYRKILLALFPIGLITLYIILAILYNFKKALKIILPSLIGVLGSIFITSLITGEINLFSIITTFLVIGFTIDYSIFRINQDEKTECAIFISCITTSFSFLLLSFCGFKLLNSMALILFFGIIISYFAGYFILSKKKS
jgi:predicted exporter